MMYRRLICGLLSALLVLSAMSALATPRSFAQGGASIAAAGTALPTEPESTEPESTEPEPTEPEPTEPEPTEPEPTEPEPTEPEPTEPKEPEEVFPLPPVLSPLPFEDVSQGAWYHGNVQAACALGIMQGVNKEEFEPDGAVELSQGITVAVRIYEKINGITPPETLPAGPWYTSYIDRAEDYGLIPVKLSGSDWNRPATRGELAAILYACVPVQWLESVNGASNFRDCGNEDGYWEAVNAMFAAGVINGKEIGLFCPHAGIIRSELAAMVTRLLCPDYRIKTENGPYTPGPGMSAFRLPVIQPPFPFTDVPADNWFYPYGVKVCALSLMNGVSSERFDPNGRVTVAQVVTTAVRIFEQYHGLTPTTGTGSDWYKSYMAKAEKYGLLPPGISREEPTRYASRQEVAAVLYAVLPGRELKPLRSVAMIPDYRTDRPYYIQVHALYEAGVLGGNDAYGTFNPDSFITRSELGTLLVRLVLPESRISATPEELPPLEVEISTYGVSGQGRELTLYRLGQGENVMLLTFALHGFEDCYDADGQLLVDTANALMEALQESYATTIFPGNWSVYIVPCANPDGIASGYTEDGPGRCTMVSLYENGLTRYKGIDLNRSFDYEWRQYTNSRNYNGTAPLQAKEAIALAELTARVKGTGHNVLIDTHGWLGQIILRGSKGNDIYNALRENFSRNYYSTLKGSAGYYAAWAGFEVGYDSCLFEFPDIDSRAEFVEEDYTGRFIRSIESLLRNYDG